MNRDSKAQLTAKKEAIINAPISHVWQIQSDINSWPKWQKEVSSAKLQGTLKPGTEFTWKAMGLNITSELQEVVENKIIIWKGKAIGMNAVHVWKFSKQGSSTKVTTEESLSGWLPTLIKIFKPNFLDESLGKSLNALKTYSEATQ